jgi:hypothetical protein
MKTPILDHLCELRLRLTGDLLIHKDSKTKEKELSKKIKELDRSIVEIVINEFRDNENAMQLYKL